MTHAEAGEDTNGKVKKKGVLGDEGCEGEFAGTVGDAEIFFSASDGEGEGGGQAEAYKDAGGFAGWNGGWVR